MKSRIYRRGVILIILLIGTAAVFVIRSEIEYANFIARHIEWPKKQSLEKPKETVQGGADNVTPVDTPTEEITEPIHANTPPDQPSNVNHSETHPHRPRSLNPEEFRYLQAYRYKEGIYKGMTLQEASYSWRVKRSEISKKLTVCTENMLKLSKINRNNVKDEISLISSVLKTMSPEDLALGKMQMLKEHQDETNEIESFFDDIKNHPEISLVEIGQKADFILKSRDANRLARKQNNAEFDKLKIELEQVFRERPKMPQLP